MLLSGPNFLGIAGMSQTSLQLSSSKLKTNLNGKPILFCVFRGKLRYCFFFCAPNNVCLLTSVPHPPSLVLSITSRPFVEAVTMYSWLVTVLLLASAANSSGGQGAVGKGWGGGVYQLVCGLCPFPITGAQVPITSYTCTQPNIAVFLDHGQCTISGGLRTCAIKEGARPTLLSSSTSLGLYGWNGNTNPFVVLDIPQGWCVENVKMMFIASSTPTLSLSVHSAERLSTNTDRTMFSLVSEKGTRLVVMNLTALAGGKYLRINMTSTQHLYLREIEVFGTSRCTFTDARNLHDMLTPLLTSLHLSSVTDDSICPHPSSAGGAPVSSTTSITPASPTTSVTPASPTTSVTPASPTTISTSIRKCTMPMCTVSIAVSTHLYRDTLYVHLTMTFDLVTSGGGVFSCLCVLLHTSTWRHCM